MVKCSGCGKIITKKTRIYRGLKGGVYHVGCGSHLKTKHVDYTK